MAYYFADDLADFITTALATTPAVGVYVGRIPDSPDDCVAVFERTGAPPLMTMTGASAAEEKSDRPRIQIRVRATKYDTGRIYAYAIFKALQGVAETTVGHTPVHLIEAVNSPAHLGIDEKQRHEWTQSFDCHIENLNR